MENSVFACRKAMLSVMEAVNENLIVPIFIGDKNEIEKCASNLNWNIVLVV